jgi:hypothetical protein
MELFDIIGSEVVLSPTSLSVPQFKALWDRDKTKTKDKATKEIKYVVFLLNYLSPYRDLPEAEREVYLKKDIIKNPNWEPDEKVKEAIEIYKTLQDTTYSRVLRDAKYAAERMGEYFRKVDFNAIDAQGKRIYTIKELSSSLKELGGIIKSLTQLEKQVRTEQLENSSVRGQAEIGLYELPNK